MGGCNEASRDAVGVRVSGCGGCGGCGGCDMEVSEGVVDVGVSVKG